MALNSFAGNSKVLQFLRRLAPPSVVDRAINSAQSGDILETSKTGSKLNGTVRDSEESQHNVSLEFLSNQDVLAQCSCSSAEEMSEQWCHHALSLLWKASELGFFENNSGFEATESTIRMNLTSPEEIAAVISEVSNNAAVLAPTNLFTPEVKIYLDFYSDRLGVKLFFDDELQGPYIFESFAAVSSRALDNILLTTLEDEGSWDENNQIWFVNSSPGIEKILGLIQEYKNVFQVNSKKTIKFDRSLLSARINIGWNATGAELRLYWVLESGEVKDKEHEILGTGPYWTCIDSALYKLSPVASRIASIFSNSPIIKLSRSQIPAVLEVLNTGLHDSEIITVLNPEKQPDTKIVSVMPKLEFMTRESLPEHFDSNQMLSVFAKLTFDYPQPPKNKNLVYLPNREEEREAIDFLKSIGFTYNAEKRYYSIGGDDALDLFHKNANPLPDKWEVAGFEDIRSTLRFADLAINLSISQQAATKDGSKEKGQTDWYDCNISLVRNNANIPLSTIFKYSRTDTERWLRLDNGSYARVPGGSLNYLKTTLGILDANFRLSNTIKTKLNMAQAVSLSRIDDKGFSLSIDQHVRGLAEKFKNFKTISNIKATKDFVGKLRSYQQEGLSWLNFLKEFELGGILADEMGLGKTVQTLALLQYHKANRTKKQVKRPSLIIAPTSVITNWLYETRRFTPDLKALLLHGPQRKALFSKISEYDVIISSYALLRIDRFDLEKHEFDFCILDEAQNIKNYQAATTKAAKAVKAKYRLALSGTPTENRPVELWSIMDYLMPGYLGTLEFFRNYIEKPILEGGPAVEVTKFLNSKTRPFILRRTKAEVEKDLPPKIESVLHVEMTPSQSQLYNQILEEVRPRVFDAVNKKGIRGASISILAALLRLRQVCNHPNSIDALKEVEGFDSGKFNLFKELIEEALESKRKILVFCQFKEMLAIMRRWLETIKTPYLYLDGSTKNRQDLVDTFNANPDYPLFLISLKAGGTGLNLTGADTVVIYDPWWNPAVESQAVDRAHRIGQTKTVSVYRLVTETSVEQKIMDLKEKKSKIVDALINENGLSTVKLTQNDLESLFSPFPTEK
jgi:non-specific serine/threonine protein kinase